MSYPDRKAAPSSEPATPSVRKVLSRRRLLSLVGAGLGLASGGFSPSIVRAEENAKPQPEPVLLSTDGPYPASEGFSPPTETEQKKQQALEVAKALAEDQLNLTPEMKRLLDGKTLASVGSSPKSPNPNYFSISVTEKSVAGASEPKSVRIGVILDQSGQMESANITSNAAPFLRDQKAADGINPDTQVGVEKVRGYLNASAESLIKGKGRWIVGRDINAKITEVPGSRDSMWQIGRTIIGDQYSSTQRVSSGQIDIDIRKVAPKNSQ